MTERMQIDVAADAFRWASSKTGKPILLDGTAIIIPQPQGGVSVGMRGDWIVIEDDGEVYCTTVKAGDRAEVREDDKR